MRYVAAPATQCEGPVKPTLLVTGGSRGIGAATARLAAARGYAVCLSYHSNATAADDVVAEITRAGGEAFAVAADVARESDVLHLFAAVDGRFGRLDALVNNAGILEHHMRVDQMTLGRLQRVMATNVIGAMLCAREAVRRMSTRHGGRGGAIVNVSSMAARLGSPNEYVDYAASKGAIDSMTIGLAKEVAAEGIRVNAVRPGVIYTDIHASGGEPGRVDRIRGSVPMQRGGTAEEVARAIVWLLSDEASYSTGTFIDVSGGR
jgi:NAD(P)-dependent dehydrogenase (short-subunit alcohol dehydrogenase family)